MRIMEIVSGVHVNGAVHHCALLSRELNRRGHKLTLLCRPGAWIAQELAGEPIDVIFSDLRRLPLDELRRVAAEIRDRGIEVVHTHMSRAAFVRRAAAVVRRSAQRGHGAQQTGAAALDVQRPGDRRLGGHAAVPPPLQPGPCQPDHDHPQLYRPRLLTKCARRCPGRFSQEAGAGRPDALVRHPGHDPASQGPALPGSRATRHPRRGPRGPAGDYRRDARRAPAIPRQAGADGRAIGRGLENRSGPAIAPTPTRCWRPWTSSRWLRWRRTCRW